MGFDAGGERLPMRHWRRTVLNQLNDRRHQGRDRQVDRQRAHNGYGGHASERDAEFRNYVAVSPNQVGSVADAALTSAAAIGIGSPPLPAK